MGLLWIEHQLKGVAGALQRVGHLQRVLEEYIVILKIVQEVKSSMHTKKNSID